MKTSLLSLYTPVLVPIYSEWISKEDLCFLDTAVCRQELRNRFLDLLRLCQNTDLVSEIDKSFAWMILRHVCVKRLSVSEYCQWNLVNEALCQSKPLSVLQIEVKHLALHLEQIQKNVGQLMVKMSDSCDTVLLKTIGNIVTDLSFQIPIEKIVCTIAECCPNLTKISAFPHMFLLPLVDACQLDEINNCHLGRLVKREECKWTYDCDLRRTSEVNDETAVCLGEGKYYHMTKLECWRNLTDEDTELLIPLLTRLTSLKLDMEQSTGSIALAAAEKCHNLTYLRVDKYRHLHEISLLIQQSARLRFLILRKCYGGLDECIEMLASSCPLLEECTLWDCDVQSDTAMSALFKNCQYLTNFEASTWPCDTVIPIVVNCESIIAVSHEQFCKSGRGLRKMNIPHSLSGWCVLFSQNPDLRCFEILGQYEGLSCLVEALVAWCPLLTRVSIAWWYGDPASLLPLSRLIHLTTLSIHRLKHFTVESISAMLENKLPSLVSLSLYDCDISGDVLTVVGRLCPGLTSLDLSDNKNIKDADIVNLLNSCSKLEMLSLRRCPLITSEILSSIKSPPMKFLNVDDTGIYSADMMRFAGVRGFHYQMNYR